MRPLPLLFLLLATPAAAAPDLIAGEEFVTQNCASCHAVGRAGDSPNLQAPPFRLLGRKYPVEHLAEALAEGIYVGHEGMPEFELEPEQIEAVIGWLASIQR